MGSVFALAIVIVSSMIAGLLLYGIYHLIDIVSVDLFKGQALILDRRYEPPCEELDMDHSTIELAWRYKHVPAERRLLLEVLEGGRCWQNWLDVNEGAFMYANGKTVDVWIGRGRLSGKPFVHHFD